jgi:diguanylate cyclase (GGDEF)-like protein/PAS domain S-box-containing protein
MSLQAKFFAFVAPVLLAIALLSPVVWYVQLQSKPMTGDVAIEAVLMTTCLIVAALLTICLAASRLVCRPMRRMAREMHRISAGEQILKPLPEAARADELGMAAQAFNEVVDAVQWTTRALRESNADLERRVAVRTEELARRNDDLEAAEKKYRSIFEHAADGIFQTTLEGRFLVVNPALVQMLGFSTETEVKKQYTDISTQLYADPGTREKLKELLLRDGRVEQFESDFFRLDGSRIWVSLSARLICDIRGKPERFEGFVRDITERKHADWMDQDRRSLLEMVARNEPLTKTLQAVCHAAERQFSQVRGVVLLYDGVRRQIGAAPQFDTPFVLALDEMMNLEDHEDKDHLFTSGKEFIPDLRIDPRWTAIRGALETEGLLACNVLPITSGHGKRIGEFVLFENQCSVLDQAAQRSMESLAGLAGMAIEHHQLTNRLEHDAVHDPLTGLPNRAQLESQLPQWIGMAARYNRRMAVLMVDLDGFKTVNDTLGHTTGDELLRQVAARLLQTVRGSDVLVRMGGDEFNLVATEIATEADAMLVASRLISALAMPFAVEGRELFVTASVGVAVYPEDGTDSASLQRTADAAMYASKAAGRNRAMRFDPKMADAASDRLELEGQLRRAISNGELYLEYQPQVNAAGEVVGVEALVRWQHPRLGRIPPMRFIPLAEQCGLIVPIGAWVLREACWQARAWQDIGCQAVRMAVNVSALQFQQSDFLDIVSTALADTALDARYLELEITESLLLASTSDAVRKVVALRDIGVGVAIDDFGTGYSSLAYLRRLPIDRLKIDQSFISELGDGPTINTEDGRGAIITAITSLATSLGKRVVAEGVETIAVRDYLIKIGCDTLQGYLFGKPMRADQIEIRLRNAGELREQLAGAA